jgi:glycopeptide antibiotics resistance protein
MTACFVAEFSCVPHYCDVVIDILFCFYPVAKTENTLFEWLQDILLLKWTKHQQFVYDNGNGVYVLKYLSYVSVGRYGKI